MKKLLSSLIVFVFLLVLAAGCSPGNKPAGKDDGKDAVKGADTIGETVINESETREETESSNNSQMAEKESNGNTDQVLLEVNESEGFFKYKANAPVKFDIDMDGSDEEIKFDSAGGKLNIAGYKEIILDTTFLQKDYFVVVNFKDKYNTSLNLIGIIDNGPSSDPSTNLYSIISPAGNKWFGSVGTIPGELVNPSDYNKDSLDDFNYKAINVQDQGIQAPVRLSVLPHATWFGRNIFTFYSTYSSLIDNINKYNQDYETRMELKTKKDIKVYSEKDTKSSNAIIKAGQKVSVYLTDNRQWVAMKDTKGTGGWVEAKDVTERSFSGFPLFD